MTTAGGTTAALATASQSLLALQSNLVTNLPSDLRLAAKVPTVRCAGIHRNLGVHISKVRSVNLDSWTPQQVAVGFVQP